MLIPLQAARIVTLFVETLLCGMFTILYGQAMWTLLYTVRLRMGYLSKQNMILCATCTAMYFFSVMHVALVLQEILEAFTRHGGSPEEIDGFLLVLNTYSHAAQIFAFTTTTILADGILTYRLYLAWGRNRTIVIPIAILVVASAAIGYRANVEILPNAALDLNGMMPWMEAGLALAISTNVIASALIAGRIVWMMRRRARYGIHVYGPSIWEIVEVVVQSAMITAACHLCLLATSVMASNTWYICLDIPSFIGINFTLIIVRVGQGRHTTHEGSDMSSIVIPPGLDAGAATKQDELQLDLTMDDTARSMSESRSPSSSAESRFSFKRLPVDMVQTI